MHIYFYIIYIYRYTRMCILYVLYVYYIYMLLNTILRASQTLPECQGVCTGFAGEDHDAALVSSLAADAASRVAGPDGSTGAAGLSHCHK